MSVEHLPVEPIAEAAEQLVSTRMESMVLPAVSLNLFYDQLVKSGDYDSDNGVSGTLQNHRATSSDIGGFYITDSHGLPVVFKFVAEIGVSTEYNKLDPYYNIFRRPGSPIPIEALKRAHASLFLKPVSVPAECSPAESELYEFHQKRMKHIIDFAQVALDKFVDDNKARDEDMFPELCQAQGVPLKSWIVASSDSWGLHVKSKNLFENVPVSQTPGFISPADRRRYANLSPNQLREALRQERMESFFSNAAPHNPQANELTLGQLQDPDNCYLDLALDYDLSMLTMPVRDWRDGTNDLVHMRDYSSVFTPSTMVYVECKLQLYNIVEGPGKRAIVRPSRVASAIIDHIRVLPNDEAAIRLMYIESARTAKDNEDRDREQEREAKEQRERDIERERKRVADENASLAAEKERKKRKLDLARRGLSTSVSPHKETVSVPGPSTGPPTVSSTLPTVASSSSSPQKSVVGTRMSTGGKPARKASKGKSARALEKERADDLGEVSATSDIEMGANL